VLVRFVRRAAVALAVVLAIVFVTRRVSRRFLFPAHLVEATADAAVAADVIRHTLVAKDGAAVHALEVRASGVAPIVVLFHGNRESIDERVDLARSIAARGLGVLLVEYRGYGRSVSAGSPSEEGLYADAEAALDMLAARGVDERRVVLFGASLGTGVAAEMARRGRGARLVLVTPFTSIDDVVTDRAPLVPARALLADHFDTLAKADAIHVPTLVIHGDADEVVPFWMGERLASRIAGARLVRVPGGRHGDLFVRDGERLIRAIVELAS
jgi:pimeloyl-ACP methyl ester carboxylesterase